MPELSTDQIKHQLGLGVDRVMAEGSLYDETAAATAIQQAQGDLTEAVFLVRAFRTTLKRFGTSRPVDTTEMTAFRRVSGIYKDIPGGQILGPTYDYTHRLIEIDPAHGKSVGTARKNLDQPISPLPEKLPRVMDILKNKDLFQRRFPLFTRKTTRKPGKI